MGDILDLDTNCSKMRNAQKIQKLIRLTDYQSIVQYLQSLTHFLGSCNDQLINKEEFGTDQFQVPISYLKMMEAGWVTFGQQNTQRNDLEDLQLVLR